MIFCAFNNESANTLQTRPSFLKFRAVSQPDQAVFSCLHSTAITHFFYLVPVVDLAIDDLLTRKKASGEKERVARIEVLNEFIESELKRWEEMPGFDKESIDSEALNAIFRSYTIEANP